MRFFLPDTDATARFGGLLAGELVAYPDPPPVFFYGTLGMGKTTLIRGLVKALPGGKNAEISSPSFTLCNIYPTTPPAGHFDLYRQATGMADESLLDFLDRARHVVLVEWAERIPPADLPTSRLECALTTLGEGREAALAAFGGAALAISGNMRCMWEGTATFYG